MDESGSGWSFSRSDWTCLRFPTGSSYSFNPTWQIFRQNVACEAAALTAHRVLLSVCVFLSGRWEAVFLIGHLKSYLQWITWEASLKQRFCVFNNFPQKSHACCQSHLSQIEMQTGISYVLHSNIIAHWYVTRQAWSQHIHYWWKYETTKAKKIFFLERLPQNRHSNTNMPHDNISE